MGVYSVLCCLAGLLLSLLSRRSAIHHGQVSRRVGAGNWVVVWSRPFLRILPGETRPQRNTDGEVW